MTKTYDVIIAGAGPIGLLLACELAMRDCSVVVLERDPKPDSAWKVTPLGRRGLNTPSVEAFYRRGLLDKFFNPGERPSTLEKKPKPQFAGHFAGITLDGNKLDLTRWKYRLPGPALTPGATTMERIETVLTERAETFGVVILRGHGVTKLICQDYDGITVEAGPENKQFRGRWLVGCDGGRSAVRKAASFDFVGTDAKFTGYAAQCDLDPPDKLQPGFNITKTGMYIVGRPNTLHLMDFDNAAFDRTQEISIEHLQDVLRRVSGVPEINITKIHLVTSFTDRSKQATTYRKGRVLLAGDAAHIHSPLGAQGLNVGLGDAMNLGWKLAATITRRKQQDKPELQDLSLLDTYEKERHPVAAWVLEWTRAQVTTLQPDPFGSAVQSLIKDLIETDDGANLFIDRVWGLSQRYPPLDREDVGSMHPLVSCSAPDFELRDGTRLGSKMHAGTGLLVDLDVGGECDSQKSSLKDLISRGDYESQLEYLAIDVQDKRGIQALLVRPDGIVAWVAEEGCVSDTESLKKALKRWFGC